MSRGNLSFINLQIQQAAVMLLWKQVSDVHFMCVESVCVCVREGFITPIPCRMWLPL